MRFYADQPSRWSDRERCRGWPGDLSIQWESTGDGVLPLDIDVEADGTVNTTFLAEGNQMLTLSATDLGGLTASDQVLIAVVGPNDLRSAPSRFRPMAPSSTKRQRDLFGDGKRPNESDLSNLTATWKQPRRRSQHRCARPLRTDVV